MPEGPRRRGRYHHGDLVAALLDAGLAHVAETGVAGFSVAEVARRVGVSTASPYRHFADRDAFVAAVAARAAAMLAQDLQRETGAAGSDARERLASAAGVYAAFVARHRVGVDTLFAPALRGVGDEELAAAGRVVIDHFLDPARSVSGDAGLQLAEQVIALAHGYAALDVTGFLATDRASEEPTATRAARAARALVDARRNTTPPTAPRPEG